MKLREANKDKRYVEPDYDSALIETESTSDEDLAAIREEALAQASEQSADEFVDEEDSIKPHRRRRRASKAKANTKTKGKGKAKAASKPAQLEQAPTSESDKPKPFTEVALYPSDPGQRWTRTYIGPIKRWTRFYELVDWWFGDKPDRRAIIADFLKLWWHHELIPPKLITRLQQDRAHSGWMPARFLTSQRAKYIKLVRGGSRYQAAQQRIVLIDRNTAFRRFIPLAREELVVFLGHVTDQKPYRISYGNPILLSDAGHPIVDMDDEKTVNGGWLLDVAGIPVSMAWLPSKAAQLLAIAVNPFSDQEYSSNRDDSSESKEKGFAIHVFRFESMKDQFGIDRPSRHAPELVRLMCGPWACVSRIQWCPVPYYHCYQLLAVLCTNGNLGVMNIQYNEVSSDAGEIFREVEEPRIWLQPPPESPIEFTCFTWINMNRIAAGCSDGSVIVYSLSPVRMLQRHPVHSTAIMDIVSGYPSDPFLVSTIPIGGVVAVTDLRRPCSETTYHPNILVSLQSNLLSWSTHMRGFASMWPSAFAGNPNLTFLPARGFPLCRHLITVNGQPTCISIGSVQPYFLAGTTDGSVWIFNVLRKLTSHREKTLKLKLFQHEYSDRVLPEFEEDKDIKIRGTCRILDGFLPEPNTHPTGVKMAETQRKNRTNDANNAKASKERKPNGKRVKYRAKSSTQPDGGEEEEETASITGPGPIVLYEPLTRITAVAWNPNAYFGCWTAVGMGSGLVRVMDVGAEPRNKGGGGGTRYAQKDVDIDMVDASDEEYADVEMAE